MTELYAVYKSVKDVIDARLAEFSSLGAHGTDAELFTEMCFCTCTPQNDANRALNAATELSRRGLLKTGSEEKIAALLRVCGVRFHNNKASYIVKNRTAFFHGTRKRIESLLDTGEIDARNELAEQVCGWGLKEASHFLRNIGHGGEICILDRHILRRLAECGVIDGVPKTLPPARYREIEHGMKKFAARKRIPVDALDLVFWYQAKGEVFK
jgi:N-glycosylase/DNA lyase